MLDFVDGLDSIRRLPTFQQLDDKGISLADLVCWLLAEEASRLLRYGLLSNYVPHEETLGVLRGRLELQPQIRRISVGWTFSSVDSRNMRAIFLRTVLSQLRFALHA
jgi:5-methylcytosine-specific restriction endonuclease McrBC regulatory subunit McrC